MKSKKYLVLGVLFLLPITVYLFFASGVNHFAKLPVMTENVKDIDQLTTFDNSQLSLESNITVLGFLGEQVDAKKGNVYNLAHKIYKKNREFKDFQFVMLVTDSQREEVEVVKSELVQIADPSTYHFIYASPEYIEEVFASLKSPYQLGNGYSSDYVFIIDKERNLRGRTDDEDVGMLYGYNATDYAEINNKMGDDIKVILAEYRLALKKYKAERDI